MSASIAVEGGIISRTPRLKRPVTSVSYSLPPARTMLNCEIPTKTPRGHKRLRLCEMFKSTVHGKVLVRNLAIYGTKHPSSAQDLDWIL